MSEFVDDRTSYGIVIFIVYLIALAGFVVGIINEMHPTPTSLYTMTGQLTTQSIIPQSSIYTLGSQDLRYNNVQVSQINGIDPQQYVIAVTRPTNEFLMSENGKLVSTGINTSQIGTAPFFPKTGGVMDGNLDMKQFALTNVGLLAGRDVTSFVKSATNNGNGSLVSLQPSNNIIPGNITIDQLVLSAETSPSHNRVVIFTGPRSIEESSIFENEVVTTGLTNTPNRIAVFSGPRELKNGNVSLNDITTIDTAATILAPKAGATYQKYITATRINQSLPSTLYATSNFNSSFAGSLTFATLHLPVWTVGLARDFTLNVSTSVITYNGTARYVFVECDMSFFMQGETGYCEIGFAVNDGTPSQLNFISAGQAGFSVQYQFKIAQWIQLSTGQNLRLKYRTSDTSNIEISFPVININ